MAKYYARVETKGTNTITLKEYDEIFSRKDDFQDTASPSAKTIKISHLREEYKSAKEAVKSIYTEQITQLDDRIADLKKLKQDACSSEAKDIQSEIWKLRAEKKAVQMLQKQELQHLRQQLDADIKSVRHREVKPVTRRSLSRTRNNIITTVENNKDKFASFVTLTFRENVTDVDEAFTKFHTYISSVRRYQHSNGDELYYLAIPEFQKRGAVHFHMIWNVECGSPMTPKQVPKRIISEGKPLTIEYYDLPYWEYGYSTAFPIQQKNELFDISLYMVKYLTKGLDDPDNPRLFARQKVLKSQNLTKPKAKLTCDPDIVDYIKTTLSGHTSAQYWHIPTSEYDHGFIQLEYKFSSETERDTVYEIIQQYKSHL